MEKWYSYLPQIMRGLGTYVLYIACFGIWYHLVQDGKVPAAGFVTTLKVFLGGLATYHVGKSFKN